MSEKKVQRQLNKSIFKLYNTKVQGRGAIVSIGGADFPTRDVKILKISPEVTDVDDDHTRLRFNILACEAEKVVKTETPSPNQAGPTVRNGEFKTADIGRVLVIDNPTTFQVYVGGKFTDYVPNTTATENE